jgi:hypothetical protein
MPDNGRRLSEPWKGDDARRTLERFEPAENLRLLDRETFGREEVVGFANRLGTGVRQPIGEGVVSGTALRACLDVDGGIFPGPGAGLERAITLQRTMIGQTLTGARGDAGTPQRRHGVVVQMSSPAQAVKDGHDV